MLYIHIGLPKTGTTFLQDEVFSRWENINYLGGNTRDITLKDLLRIDKSQKYLISKEHLANENNLLKLGEMLPDAKIMVGFRRHHKKITSSYKQWIQGLHGTTLSFTEFFDVENNKGVLKRESIDYKKKLNHIEKRFNYMPFVFLQEELSENLPGLLKDMEYFLGEEGPDPNELLGRKSNKGIGYYQSIVLIKINHLFESPIGTTGSEGLIPYNRHLWFVREIIKYILQNYLTFSSSKPIKMNEKQKKLTDEYYSDDWNYVLDYIKYQCPYRSNFDDAKYR